MSGQTLKLELTGVAPIILHNGQTADPNNYFSKLIKAVTSKRTKVEADYLEISRLEWYASLYIVNDKKQIGIPGEVMEAMIINGAKKFRLGNQAKSSLYVPGSSVLKFNGDDLTVDQLWERDLDAMTNGVLTTSIFIKPVRVGTSKVIRTRFIAHEWSFVTEINYLGMDAGDIVKIAKKAGEEVGLCEWRPRYGRFTVQVLG